MKARPDFAFFNPFGCADVTEMGGSKQLVRLDGKFQRTRANNVKSQ